MKALTFHRPFDIRCETVPDPSLLAATDALVAITAAGLCGSDLHAYRGLEGGLDAGTVCGHELVGEIVAIGREVTQFMIGDRVVAPFTTNCGECWYCRRGWTCRCVRGNLLGWVQDGVGLHGAQAELIRVPLAGATLYPLPATLPEDVALFLGDVLPTGFHAAESAGVGPGTVVAVVGCGPIGLSAVLSALELGAERVFAVDAVPERLALAERWGATALNLTTCDAGEHLRDATDGRGADAVIEAVGSHDATRLAFDLVRPVGTIAAAGVHTEAHLAFSPGEAYDKNLTYRAGRCPARAVLPQVLPLAERRAGELGELISHRLPLEAGAHAYEIFDRKLEGCTKVVFRPGSAPVQHLNR
jgi:threonine dehydrogenase-like Zn-dependent dehydrogenase